MSRLSFCNTTTLSYLLLPSNHGNKPCNVRLLAPLANKNNDSSQTQTQEHNNPFPTTKLLIQSAVGVFALGFIDAGYSGDWSRIGVISRGTEDLLKVAAFFVVPLCVFLIISLSKGDRADRY